VTAAARGGETDGKPTISAFGGGIADAIAVERENVGSAIDQHPESAVLATVLSPLGLAMAERTNIVAELHADIDLGNKKLGELTERTRDSLHTALHDGADGVFYVLDGAYPGTTTPMEYGGHFLEIDRHLLAEVQDARFNVLYVRGEQDPYLDFVSDLPAHAFAWDPRSGVRAEQVRQMRHGALATADDDGEFRLIVGAAAEVAG
jgi:hypothetical protein